MTVTPVEVSAAVKNDIARLGGGFMLSDQAKAAAKGAGTGGWALYMLGRGGVLGEVHPDVIAAAFHFFPPETVHKGWVKARSIITPAAAVELFTGACHEWGRRHLAEAKGLDRLAVLLDKAALAAPVAGAPLFAGWRAVPLPADAPARVTQLAHVLREYRGAIHGVCCLAAGLTPLESVLTSGGEGNAKFFGWAEPFADVTHLKPTRDYAEAITDSRACAPWAALDDEERAELLPLLAAAGECALVSMSRQA
ncbi:MAG TPA: hypothetical protein VNA14_01180 [Mycobacteriales bacterium]|nr:hypothetical protein [Mycobacteriales bacterium]